MVTLQWKVRKEMPLTKRVDRGGTVGADFKAQQDFLCILLSPRSCPRFYLPPKEEQVLSHLHPVMCLE